MNNYNIIPTLERDITIPTQSNTYLDMDLPCSNSEHHSKISIRNLLNYSWFLSFRLSVILSQNFSIMLLLLNERSSIT